MTSDHDELERDEDDVFDEAFLRGALAVVTSQSTDDFARYHDDPIGFFNDVLGVEPWESEDPKQHGQTDILRALGIADRVAVKSGHKVSKSCTAAGTALWWVATRKGARAVLTAPTYNQVKGILWKELRNRFRERGLADRLGADLPLDPSTGLQLPNGNEIIGLSTKTKENLAGLSGAALLFVIDEASGFPDELFEVIMGNAAGGAKIFAITNPTRTSGWFFELFRRKAKGWTLFTISSENTPNVRAKRVVIPGLATWEWVEEMREACGPDYEHDATYMVRVRGEFPPQGTDAVIGAWMYERACARWSPAVPAVDLLCELVLGVDCARYGNDANVIQPTRGAYAYEPTEVDTSAARTNPKLVAGMMVADAVITRAMALRVGAEVVRVNIDGIGVGSSVVDFLKASEAVRKGWIYLVDMNVGEEADAQLITADESKTDYSNLRSQLWFGCADWLKTGAIPDHDRLGAELLVATYGFDERGRKRVEKKDKMRALLGGRSPDHADALCLATYRGTRGAITRFTYDPVARGRTGPGTYQPSHGFGDYDADDDDDGGSRGRRGRGGIL